MNKPGPSGSIAQPLLGALLLLTLVGCDGGLFGTGDGSDVILPNTSAPSTGDGTGSDNPENPVIGSPTDSSDREDPPLESTDDMEPTREFQNLLITSTTLQPLITLINASSQTLNIVSDESVKPLFELAVTPGSRSQHAALSLSVNSLKIVDSDNKRQLFQLSPLRLASSSVTTLIARDQVAQPALSELSNLPGLEIIALRSITTTGDPTIAMLRIVQAGLLSSTDTIAAMALVPSGAEPGGGEVHFDSIALSTAQDSDYMSINAGTYQLRDSLSRFEPVSLSLKAATVYTLIITSTIEPVLIIEQDSDVTLQNNAY